MELLQRGPVRWVLGGVLILLLVYAARRIYRWYGMREDRELEAQLRAALDRGDLKRAGEIQVQRGNLLEATRIFQRGGENVRAAEILAELGNLKEAAEAFEKAGEHLRAAPLFRKLGETAKAAAGYEKSGQRRDRQLAAESYESLGEWLKAGRIYQDLELYEQAARCFAKVEDLEALDVALTMLENAALAKKDDAAAAKALWTRAGELATKLGAHERAARAFDEAGDFKRAASVYENSLKRFDLAAALFAEAGDTVAEARCTAAASAGSVIEARLKRARARGDTKLVTSLESARTSATRVDGGPGASAPTEKEASTVLAKENLATGATALAPPVDAARRRNRLGDRFELLGELGRGGMGVVFRARDHRLARDVAMKFLPEDAGPDSVLVGLFHREARAAAALSHPGIVTVYDVGTLDGRDFIAMELVDGTTLDRVLDESGPLPVDEAFEVMEKVLVAIAFAHEKSVIHRDLKPANLMRTKTGIKVMDFGLAKIVNAKTGSQTVVGGTPNYMPPEQKTGHADHRSDVFALGATFYELLTGVLPGRPGEPVATGVSFPSPRERNKAIPARLSELIMRCLEVDRNDRPQDVVTVLRELREARALHEKPAERSPAAEAKKPAPQPQPQPAAAAPAVAPLASQKGRARPIIAREDPITEPQVVARDSIPKEAPKPVPPAAERKRAPVPIVRREEEDDAPPPKVDKVELRKPR
ncbi:MAG: protein kinase [Polyangiaceae bacterium]